MAGEDSIWLQLGAHSIVDWDARFSEAERAINAPINSSLYFTQRMEAAVALLTSIQDDLRAEVRQAAARCVVASDLENPEELAGAVLNKVLSRCIDTIHAQIAGGKARGLLNYSMLEGYARGKIKSAQERHSALARLMAAELEQRRQQLGVPEGVGSRPIRKHSVCLIHGIRTRAEWADRAASILKKADPSIRAVPLRYGFFDAIRFLLPWSWTRKRPILRITRLLRDEIARKPDQVSIIAHSFGTYILARILEDENDIRFHRVILCGSIVPDDFPWENFSHRLDPDREDSWHAVNDCGMRDIWPVLAASATWGYGSSGRFGFGHGRVKDRFFDIGHGDFFSEDHIRTNWLPYVTGGVVEDGVLDRATTPWWVSFLTVLKVRYLLAPVVVAVMVAAIAAVAWLVRNAMEQDDVHLERPGLHLGMSWGEFSKAMKDVQLSTNSERGKMEASYNGTFWNLPAHIKHEFVEDRLATSLITIKAEECDAVMYDAERKPIGTASQQCGVGPTTIDADSVCKEIGRKYQSLVIATGGPVDRLENRYIAEQWLGGEIIKQHGGNGWQQQWPAGGKKDSARLERFKVSADTYVQFQLVEWHWDYWTIDPDRQPDRNVRLNSPFPFPMSDHYTRFGCFLQYRVSATSNFDWDLRERRY